MELSEMTTEQFIEHLKQLSQDFRESAMHATADDYDEMIRRLRDGL